MTLQNIMFTPKNMHTSNLPKPIFQYLTYLPAVISDDQTLSKPSVKSYIIIGEGIKYYTWELLNGNWVGKGIEETIYSISELFSEELKDIFKEFNFV